MVIIMRLRAPAVPLMNVDPFFSVWSMGDRLNESQTKHWTGRDNTVLGSITVDGKEFIFMGLKENSAPIPPVSYTHLTLPTILTV